MQLIVACFRCHLYCANHFSFIFQSKCNEFCFMKYFKFVSYFQNIHEISIDLNTPIVTEV